MTISGGTRRLPLALTSAVLMLGGATGTAAAEPLTDYDGYKVAAYDGRQAWSHQLGGGRFELLLRENGRMRALAVRSQPRHYDVTLGRDGRGNPVAVYAWCPAASNPGRCRLRMIDLASGRDRAVPGTHLAGASEYLPALSNGRLMFARRGRRTDGQGHHIVSVRIKRLGTRSPARVLRRAFLLNVVGTALSPRGAAFAVVDFATGRGENKLYARRAGGRVTLVARTRLLTNMYQTSPTFRRGVLYWGASDLAATPAAGHVLRCRDHRVRAAPTDGTVTSVAADPVAGGAPLLVSLRMDAGAAQVATLRPAGWGALPRDVIVRRCPF
jgi:hypothetical protein